MLVPTAVVVDQILHLALTSRNERALSGRGVLHDLPRHPDSGHQLLLVDEQPAVALLPSIREGRVLTREHGRDVAAGVSQLHDLATLERRSLRLDHVPEGVLLVHALGNTFLMDFLEDGVEGLLVCTCDSICPVAQLHARRVLLRGGEWPPGYTWSMHRPYGHPQNPVEEPATSAGLHQGYPEGTRDAASDR